MRIVTIVFFVALLVFALVVVVGAIVFVVISNPTKIVRHFQQIRKEWQKYLRRIASDHLEKECTEEFKVGENATDDDVRHSFEFVTKNKRKAQSFD